ncbi:TRADD-N-associated membrane domain-containing protein [Planococcus shixiaomingii]|uniref:TRADD-N-associated membrane domain-containing protein n=1 Tax=Planococcus shixiaomingii TaxID=3058393 RepID=UPI00262BD766|nr:hypothetical protein [Planococcus sp. N022]WKA53438.1 hypothetical protein QWY21_12285 [Planococcus sp. N022]
MDDTSGDRKILLKAQKNEIIMKNDKLLVRRRVLMGLGIFLIILSFLSTPLINATGIESGSSILTVRMMFITYGFVILLVTFARPRNLYQTDLQEIEKELDLLDTSLSSKEERAEKLFKHHHLELKRYYDENLKQSSWVFIVGIVCIFAGFAIIGFTLYLLYENLSSEIENKIIIASIGAIGAILTNFIAVIFLKMHAETIKSLTQFHHRFVNTHHFYFSTFLIHKIADVAKRDEALIKLAINISANDNSEVARIEKEEL